MLVLPICLSSCGQPSSTNVSQSNNSQQGASQDKSVEPAINARDLFYQQLDQPGAGNSTSANGNGVDTFAYCIELKHGGNTSNVTNEHSFVAGDAIRFHMKSTTPVYVYVVLFGSSGKAQLIFPQNKDQDNKVTPGSDCMIPGKGSLVFDNSPGAELLQVTLSPQPINFEKASRSAFSRANDTNCEALFSDLFTGRPEKAGQLSIVSAPSTDDGRNDAGWVYVNNRTPDRPVDMMISLNHRSSETAEANPNARVQYSVRCLGGSVPCMVGDLEPCTSMAPMSKLNRGDRDLYLSGLNHLYVNSLTQRLYSLYYTQVPGSAKTEDSGERVLEGGFNGSTFVAEGQPINSPGPVATIDGIAAVQQMICSGNCSLIAGESMTFRNQNGTTNTLLVSYRNKKVSGVRTGKDLDAQWEAHGEKPLILAISCQPKMFGGGGGHVVVVSARRKSPSPVQGASSDFQYYVMNSWGKEQGRGWASADHLAYAMNYNCEVADPTEKLSDEKGLICTPDSRNSIVQAKHGLELGESNTWTKTIDWSKFDSNRGVSNPDDSDGSDHSNDIKHESDRLAAFIASPDNELTGDEQAICKQALTDLLRDTTDSGTPRPFPLNSNQKLFILQQTNRLFSEQGRVFAQGLSKQNRNQAVTAMLHDAANPEHMNQGHYMTCNVTTIAQIEEMLRPAAQSKRFVDMYTNVNGDQSVNFP